jgi:NAD(P)-dependent dehydrogenase (short-subunit alcohol dehydrogenase family)
MDKLVQVAEHCREVGAPEAHALKLDLLDFKSHAAVAEHVASRFGRIDYVRVLARGRGMF